jgi:undecaprenyl-diphosphatase
VLVGLGTLVSAVTAFIVVKWLLRFVQTHTLNVFGYYRIALGALIFASLGLMDSANHTNESSGSPAAVTSSTANH